MTITPRHDTAYERIADAYDAVFTDAISQAENRVIFAHLRQVLRRCPGLTLDLGCGTGLCLEELPVAPDAYLGLDLAPAMLARARAKFPAHRFALGTMAQLPCPERSAALVVSTFGSFCYCPEPDAVVREAWRVLQPGGSLFLMCYTPGYQARPDYVFNRLGLPQIPATTWTPESLTRDTRAPVRARPHAGQEASISQSGASCVPSLDSPASSHTPAIPRRDP